jgi:hypothetical protein
MLGPRILFSYSMVDQKDMGTVASVIAGFEAMPSYTGLIMVVVLALRLLLALVYPTIITGGIGGARQALGPTPIDSYRRLRLDAYAFDRAT